MKRNIVVGRFALGKRPAFTLIELLVVIAIIAILAAILFPVFAQAREKARAISCLSNLKQIGNATVMYAQDYDETLPGGWNDSKTAKYQGANMWRVCLQPYIQKYGDPNNLTYGDTTGKGMGVFRCPDLPTSAPTNYGYNCDELCTGWAADSTGAYGTRGLTLAEMKQPANLVAYADAGNVTGYTGDPNFKSGMAYCDVNAQTGDCGPYNMDPTKWQEDSWGADWNFGVPGTGGGDWTNSGNGFRRPMARHSGFYNAAFCDGHAKPLPAKSMNAKLGSSGDYLRNHN